MKNTLHVILLLLLAPSVAAQDQMEFSDESPINTI